MIEDITDIVDEWSDSDKSSIWVELKQYESTGDWILTFGIGKTITKFQLSATELTRLNDFIVNTIAKEDKQS